MLEATSATFARKFGMPEYLLFRAKCAYTRCNRRKRNILRNDEMRKRNKTEGIMKL
jgi:hypothetical protein